MQNKQEIIVTLSNTRQGNDCPICNTLLIITDISFSLSELFKLWEPVTFSQETIQQHGDQSEYTRMYVCPKCKLEIFLPQIIGTPNFYVDLLKHQSCYFYSDEKWDFDEALKDAKNCNSVIEIGCGPGNFLAKIKPYVTQVLGTEYNEHALEVARTKGLDVLGIEDVDAHKMKGKFDAVFSFHVLEHVADPVAFVQYMLSWIKPGGKIGISVPNMDGPVKYIKPCVSNMPPHHATRWKLQTFKIMAELLELKIERFAFEPLTEKAQNYYSIYWINHVFHGNSLLMKLLRLTGNKAFYCFFKTLSIFGKKSTSLLKGQSLYVFLSKSKRL